MHNARIFNLNICIGHLIAPAWTGRSQNHHEKYEFSAGFWTKGHSFSYVFYEKNTEVLFYTLLGGKKREQVFSTTNGTDFHVDKKYDSIFVYGNHFSKHVPHLEFSV